MHVRYRRRAAHRWVPAAILVAALSLADRNPMRGR